MGVLVIAHVRFPHDNAPWRRYWQDRTVYAPEIMAYLSVANANSDKGSDRLQLHLFFHSPLTQLHTPRCRWRLEVLLMRSPGGAGETASLPLAIYHHTV